MDCKTLGCNSLSKNKDRGGEIVREGLEYMCKTVHKDW